MSAKQLEGSAHDVSDVPETPESTNLVAMALNDSTPDLLTPIEINILKDDSANANIEVDAGMTSLTSQEKKLTEELLERDGAAVDVLCTRLTGLKFGKVATAESPSSSFEDLSGMPGKIAKNEADVSCRVPRLINPLTKDDTFVPCSKCNRKYLAGLLKNHEMACKGEPEDH